MFYSTYFDTDIYSIALTLLLMAILTSEVPYMIQNNNQRTQVNRHGIVKIPLIIVRNVNIIAIYEVLFQNAKKLLTE